MVKVEKKQKRKNTPKLTVLSLIVIFFIVNLTVMWITNAFFKILGKTLFLLVLVSLVLMESMGVFLYFKGESGRNILKRVFQEGFWILFEFYLVSLFLIIAPILLINVVLVNVVIFKMGAGMSLGEIIIALFATFGVIVLDIILFSALTIFLVLLIESEERSFKRIITVPKLLIRAVMLLKCNAIATVKLVVTTILLMIVLYNYANYTSIKLSEIVKYIMNCFIGSVIAIVYGRIMFWVKKTFLTCEGRK